MVRKRTYPQSKDSAGESPVFATGLNELSKRQEEGKAAYGDAVLNKDQRLGQSHIFFVGLSAPQPRPKQVTYIPPARVTPSSAEITDVLNEMTRDTIIPDEELRLVEEARRLGWSWQKIAGELQGRTVKQLIRAYSEPRQNTNRYLYDHARLVRPRMIMPSAVLDPATRMPHPPLRRPSSIPATKYVRTAQKIEAPRNTRRAQRMEDDSRVMLSKPIDAPPADFTGAGFHRIADISAIKFFEEARVVDTDDPLNIFTFNLQDPVHCACFNIGEGEDGSPLLSWSDLYAFYQLPDGSKWAEHGYLYDKEDLESFARKSGKDFRHLIPENMNSQELIKKKGRFRSRLCKIEHECWIYNDEIPENHTHEEDDYFYRVVFDPTTMTRIENKAS